METFSSFTGHLCGEFTGHRWIPRTNPVTRSFDVFLDLLPNKRMSKQQWWGWWFETPSWPLWRHCNGRFVYFMPGKVKTGTFLTHPTNAAYMSVNWASIGSGNGLSPVGCQAITWANTESLSIGLGNTLQWNLNGMTILSPEGGDELTLLVRQPGTAYLGNKPALLFNEEIFQLAASTWCWEMIENADIFLCLLRRVQHKKGWYICWVSPVHLKYMR